MNHHMNLFVPYSQGDAIENNFSRGLAIILKENELCFERFIDLVNDGLVKARHKPLQKHSSPEEKSVDIQKSASNLARDCEGILQIVPVTLTPEEADNEEKSGGAEKPIPDIAIVCAENLVIVEVKAKGSSAHAQVIHQADSIISNGVDAEKTPVVHLKWQDVIQVLQNVQSIHSGDIVLDDYVKYLEENRPSWFPVRPFTSSMNSSLVWKRIEILARNCAEILKRRDDDVYAGESDFSYKIVKPSLGYVKEFHLVPVSQDGSASAENFHHLSVWVWLGNSRYQSRQLFEAGNIRDNMSWTLQDSISADGKDFSMSITPYIKFAHIQGKYLGSASPDVEIFGTDREKIKADFADKLSAKRWYRDSWPELKDFLNSHGMSSAVPIIEETENSGKNFIDVSVGYEISIDIPHGLIEQTDKHNNFQIPQNDKIAFLVVDIIDSLRSLIETHN